MRRDGPKYRGEKWGEENSAVAAIPIAANHLAGLDGFLHVVHALKRRPRRINDEGGKTEEDHQRLEPPDIGAGRFAKAALLRQGISVCHNGINSSYYPVQRQRALRAWSKV